MSEYVYQPYPAWRFHPTLPGGKVFTAAECAALGDDWVDSPAKLPGSGLPPEGPAPAPAPPPKEPPPMPDLTPDEPANEPATTAPAKKSHHKKKDTAE